MNRNKKLLIGGAAGIAAVALAVGGTTYSAWSDFTDVTGNDAGAGVLTLNVGPNNGSDLLFSHVKMAPGGINQERNVYIASNDLASTPNAKLFVSITHLVGTEDGCDGNAEVADDPACGDPASPGQFIRDASMQFTSYAVNSPGDCTSSYAPAGKAVTALYGGSLTALATTLASTTNPRELTGNGSTIGGTDVPVLTPGEGLCVSMTLGLAHAVNNASQGDSASWTTHFDLIQSP